MYVTSECVSACMHAVFHCTFFCSRMHIFLGPHFSPTYPKICSDAIMSILEVGSSWSVWPRDTNLLAQVGGSGSSFVYQISFAHMCVHPGLYIALASRPKAGYFGPVTFQTYKLSWLVKIMYNVIVIQLLGLQVYSRAGNFNLIPSHLNNTPLCTPYCCLPMWCLVVKGQYHGNI